MAGGRPVGSLGEKLFGTALRQEIAAAGGDNRELRAIARNLLFLAKQPEQAALAAIREVGDRLDGKARQETEVTLRTAVASELSDDDLAAIAVGASRAHQEAMRSDTNVVPMTKKPDPSELN